MFTYSYSHDSGVTFTAAYINASAAVTAVSYSDFGVEYTGVDGLTIGYATGDSEVTVGAEIEEHTMYAKYAMGGITVGVQVSEADASGSSQDYETAGMGISYQVNDDLAVSYGAHEIEAVGSGNPDQETSAVSASYTMGSLSIKASVHNGDNIGNSSTNNREAYNLSLGFAF